MHKSVKARKEQFKQVDFFQDTYKIVIHAPTFKSLSQAFSYFVQHVDDFAIEDEGDFDDIPESVIHPITDVHDAIDNFEDRLRAVSRQSPTEPTPGGDSAESSKLSSEQSAREPTPGGEQGEPGAAQAAPDTQ